MWVVIYLQRLVDPEDDDDLVMRRIVMKLMLCDRPMDGWVVWYGIHT